MKNKLFPNEDDLIDLSKTPLSSLGQGDIRGKRFVGDAHDLKFDGNFIECSFYRVSFYKVDFSRCDWKDCRVEESIFHECDLSQSSVITNFFKSCEYIGCTFFDSGLSNCEFYDCTLTRCSLQHVIIKQSEFYNVGFFDSLTSNKMIEDSLFFLCSFENMDLEAGLILDNLGLKMHDLKSCSLFVRNEKKEKSFLEWSTLEAIVNSRNSLMDSFKYSYFCSGDFLAEADLVDKILNPKNWITTFKIHQSFSTLLENFVRFMLYLYEKLEIPVYPIVIFHTYNFHLLQYVQAQVNSHSMFRVVSGLHLLLTREVDRYITSLHDLNARYRGHDIIRFSANGPLDKNYFQGLLLEANLKNIRIVDVRPRNSPVEVISSFPNAGAAITFLALFLVTKSKVELLKINRGDSDSKQIEGVKQKDLKVFSFSSGLSKEHPATYEFDFSTILPHSLLLNLNLKIGTSTFKKVQKTIVNLLDNEEKE